MDAYACQSKLSPDFHSNDLPSALFLLYLLQNIIHSERIQLLPVQV
jgi:hypothetical protein